MKETKELTALKAHSSIDFTTMLHALTRPGAFPFTMPGDKPIPIIQTHVSAVLLTPDRIYKLKKPKDFGFFDYSTLADTRCTGWLTLVRDCS